MWAAVRQRDARRVNRHVHASAKLENRAPEWTITSNRCRLLVAVPHGRAGGRTQQDSTNTGPVEPRPSQRPCPDSYSVSTALAQQDTTAAT
jgi:hypothetical protein